MGLADASEAVLAGSPPFLNAVLPPLAAALGVRPRIADAPHQVFALCQDGARVLICEYRGQEWLPLVEDLKTTFGDELRILVAVPPERATSSGPLTGAGADEVLPWDGKPEALVAAAARLAGLPAETSSPAPQRPVPASSGPAPARSASPPAQPAVPPARPHAAGLAGGAPVPARPAPAITPARPAPAVPSARPTPTLTPVRPVAAVTPVRTVATAAPPAPRPGEPPPLAVDAGAALAPSADYFADLDHEDGPRFSIVEAPPDAAARWGNAELIAFERSGTWPGTVLASRDAEGLLAGALAGFWPERADLKGHTERIVADLSPLERDAIAGRPVPADPAPVCRAAALRWQVSAALATAPAPGSPVDAAAVRAILAEIDAVLVDLKQASQGAPAEALSGLDHLRRDLVAEAVDLTDAVHRIAPQEAPPAEEPTARPAAAGRTRLLSMQPSEVAADQGERRRRVGTWVALGLAVALGAAYHGWRVLLKPAPPPMPRAAGAPAGFIAPPVASGVKLLAPEPGKPADPAEVEKFRLAEELKGNRVQEIRGVLVVTPDRAAAAPGGSPPPK